MAAPSNLVQTIIGGAIAVFTAVGGLYTIALVPLTARIEKLESGREKDSDQLARLYTSIQTNDEYKKIVRAEIEWLRSDLKRNDDQTTRIDEEQKRRATSVSSIVSIEKRIDNLVHRNEEQDRRTAPSLIDEVKTLRGELDNLRQRIMVPLAAAPR